MGLRPLKSLRENSMCSYATIEEKRKRLIAKARALEGIVWTDWIEKEININDIMKVLPPKSDIGAVDQYVYGFYSCWLDKSDGVDPNTLEWWDFHELQWFPTTNDSNCDPRPIWRMERK